MNRPSFVIVSPKGRAGGIIVLHELCRALTRQGCESKVFYIKDSIYKKKVSYWFRWIRFTVNDLLKKKDKRYSGTNSFGGCKRKWLPFVSRNTIVVYPEIVFGNILHSKKTVRWLLSYNRYEDQPEAYGNDDLFVCFRLQFNDETLNPSKRVLFVSYYNFELYRRTNYGDRSGKCYIIYKAKDRNDLPDKYDGIVVDGMTEAEKVKVFNECEYCYCYDLQTAYSTIAALCGCITILVPESGKTVADYRCDDDFKSCGVAFGMDEKEIEYARRTIPDVKKQLDNRIKDGEKSVSEFIVLCLEYFAEVDQYE